ncbi:SurA N-terminal domain-containing protein [Candidatus Microgenomates bacterium]|nr:SurA N-terminal domain-containing protein [Candidatus Microgenomates bacterium]
MPKVNSKVNPSTSLRARTQKSKLITRSAVAVPKDIRPSFAAGAGGNIFSSISRFRVNKTWTIIILMVVFLGILFYFKRSWFIAATVNGSPITNFELLSQMNSQYRQQTLTDLINQQIIKDEIRKSGITVAQSEIDEKLTQIELNVGGAAALDSLLSQQGQTRFDLSQQIKLQLGLEKLYVKEATVSADEVADYVAKNKSQLTATDSAGQVKEAEETLRQQKLTEVFTEKFQQLRSNAKVTIF